MLSKFIEIVWPVLEILFSFLFFFFFCPEILGMFPGFWWTREILPRIRGTHPSRWAWLWRGCQGFSQGCRGCCRFRDIFSWTNDFKTPKILPVMAVVLFSTSFRREFRISICQGCLGFSPGMKAAVSRIPRINSQMY